MNAHAQATSPQHCTVACAGKILRVLGEMLLTMLLADDEKDNGPSFSSSSSSSTPSSSAAYEVTDCYPEYARLPCPMYPSLVKSLNHSKGAAPYDWQRFEEEEEEEEEEDADDDNEHDPQQQQFRQKRQKRQKRHPLTLVTREARRGVFAFEVQFRAERLRALALAERRASSSREKRGHDEEESAASRGAWEELKPDEELAEFDEGGFVGCAKATTQHLLIVAVADHAEWCEPALDGPGGWRRRGRGGGGGGGGGGGSRRVSGGTTGSSHQQQSSSSSSSSSDGPPKPNGYWCPLPRFGRHVYRDG
jgi:hypothetical protein